MSLFGKDHKCKECEWENVSNECKHWVEQSDYTKEQKDQNFVLSHNTMSSKVHHKGGEALDKGSNVIWECICNKQL